MKHFQNIKLSYLFVAVITLLVFTYIGFKHSTVISCKNTAKVALDEYGERNVVSLSDAVLIVETGFNTCMRDKGFSNL